MNYAMNNNLIFRWFSSFACEQLLYR